MNSVIFHLTSKDLKQTTKRKSPKLSSRRAGFAAPGSQRNEKNISADRCAVNMIIAAVWKMELWFCVLCTLSVAAWPSDIGHFRNNVTIAYWNRGRPLWAGVGAPWIGPLSAPCLCPVSVPSNRGLPLMTWR